MSKIKSYSSVVVSNIADGATYYTWIKYADSPTSGMSDSSSGKKYIGIAYNKDAEIASDNYSDYSWSVMTGNGIVSVVQEFAISTSKSDAPTSDWSETQPSWSSGEYLWKRMKITYTDSDEPQYTTPECDSSWEAINDIEIGGRNLIPNSNFANGTDGWTGYGASIAVVSFQEYDHVLRIINPSGTTGRPDSIYVAVDRNRFKHESNTTYTLSFMAISSSTNYRLRSGVSGPSVKCSKLYNVSAYQFEKYTYTYNTGDLSSGALSQLIFWVTNGTGPIYITNVKLEKGNKATDWSPAPEDVDYKIDEIRETISGVSSKVDQNTKSITDKVWQTDITKEIDEYDNVIGQSIRDRLTQTETDIYGVKTTVSSVESELNNKADGSTVQELNTKISQVEQDAENFKVTISETYATKQNVSDSINDIEIGGRNLIPNSNFANGTDGWVGQSYTLTSLTDSNYGHVLRISSNGTSAGSTTKIYVDKNKFVHESNTTYTLSFMAKNSTGSNLAIISSVVGLSNSKSYKTKTHSITTQWAKYTCTYTTGTLSNDAVLAFWLNMPGLVYITNVKLEKGTKSTDWTPAPEDVQGQIDNNASMLSNHETRINANQSSIELQVQSLEEYKGEVSSRFTETNTSILALDGKISSKVEQVDIDKAIDNLQIGFRNLIRNAETLIFENYYFDTGVATVGTAVVGTARIA